MTSLLAILSAAMAAALLLRPRRELPVSPLVPGGRGSLPPLPLAAGACAAVTVLLVVPFPVGVPVALGVAAVTVHLVRRLEPAAVRRRRAQLEAALPHVVDLMSTCLAAGGSPAGALTQLVVVLESPVRDELAAFTARLALGSDPVSVWAAMASHPQLGALGRALLRSAETGAAVSQTLERLGSELRAERRAVMEARARTVEVKASLPLGVCLLPAFVLVGIVPLVAGSFSLTFLSP